ncbi:MAG: hypothetical protein P0116_15840 [Candidatus Nitrosocosmicus sp.]|nr:hypothetical protein [Candidatus Nitrosocosmicus sp.]
MQIKLDVESEIEKKSIKILNMPLYSKYLIHESIDIKKRSQMTFKEYKKRPKNLIQFYLFDYKIKISWDSLRYANAGNDNNISCINECTNCGYIFACLVSIEGFPVMKCEKCNHNRIQLFEFEKDLGNLLLDKSK